LFQLPASLTGDWTARRLIPTRRSTRKRRDSASDAVREEFRRAGITLDDDARSIRSVRGTRAHSPQREKSLRHHGGIWRRERL